MLIRQLLYALMHASAIAIVIDYAETEFVYFSSYQYESDTNGFLTFSRLNWQKTI